MVQDPGWAPIEFSDKRGIPSGMSNDYLNLVEQRLGIKFVRIHNLSWQEAYSRLKRWEIDMTTCVAMTPERNKFWAFTKPYMIVPIVIVTQSNVTYISTMKELAGKKVAVVDGYAVDDWIPKDFPEIRLVRVKTTQDGLKLLQRNEVFAFIDNMLIVGYHHTQLNTINIKIAGETPYVNAQCMAVRKDWAILAGIIQKALDSISDQERNDIYMKWLPIRYEHGFNYNLFWKILIVLAGILFTLILWNKKLSQEIINRKKAEDALSRSEEKYRELIDGMNETVWVIDFNGKLIDVNKTAVELLGYSKEELLAIGLFGIDITMKKEDILSLVKNMPANKLQIFETAHTTKDGRTFPVEIYSSLVTYQGEKSILSIARDITKRKRAEEALQESERKLSEAHKMAQLGHWQWDIKTGRVEWSEEVFHIFRLDPKEYTPHIDSILALSPWPVDHERDKELIQRAMETHEKGSYEQRFLRPDKTIGYYHSTFQGKYDSMGNLIAIIGTIQDITERKRAEEEKSKLEVQLQQSQKLESIGRLAGGVAHDFNNMLQTILGYTEMTLEEVGPDNPLRENFLEIQKAALHSAELTRQLLAFARKQAIAPITLDLNDTVAGMLKMLSRLIGEDIDLIWKPGLSLWKVKMDPSQIDQILVNLTINAKDSITGVGKITIETGMVEFDASYCSNHTGYLPGKYVLLAVSDTGCGMDETTVTHIFEPFFTTKEMGHGTGLGLSTIYGIIQQNHGFLNVSSEPEKGTTFKIYFPAQEAILENSAVTDIPAEIPKGTETILLVEDEESLLKLAKTMLEKSGYTVLAANNPILAIQLAQEYTGTIHLLITDVVMPKMSGRDLCLEICKLQALTRCLYMSGYTRDIIANQGILDEGVNFIQKPFSLESLAFKIREVLNQ